MKTKQTQLFFLLGLSLCSYSNISFAECARDDVNFYLEKGFTPEQITTICSKTSGKKNTADQQETEQTKSQPAPEKNIELFFKEAIKGRNVSLSNDTLQYTVKNCFEFGQEDLYGFANKACPLIKFTIARANLEIIKSQKKYIFFGDNEIKIKGSIKREIIGGLEKNKEDDLDLIKSKIESGDYTFIPVRDDISLDEVEQALLQISQ